MTKEKARRILRRAGIRHSRDLARWMQANPGHSPFSALRAILGHGAYVDGRWMTTDDLTAWMLPLMQPRSTRRVAVTSATPARPRVGSPVRSAARRA